MKKYFLTCIFILICIVALCLLVSNSKSIPNSNSAVANGHLSSNLSEVFTSRLG